MDETKIIRIFEDRKMKLDLTKQNVKDILHMRDIIGENNVVIQADSTLLIRHFVGFIQINKTRLLVYPKISMRMTNLNEYEKSSRVLMKLLSYSGYEGIRKLPSPQEMDLHEGDLLELFIEIFVDELLLQFKRDINRGYNFKLENETFIKGKVDFVETIKKNSFKKHLHFVEYDQFSEDIILNQVFKSVVQNLISRTNSKQNRLKLKQSLLWLEDVDSMPLEKTIWEKIKITRHNSKYASAFNMARLLYYNSSPGISSGSEYTLSFLVPVNKLFEFYLFKVLENQSYDGYEIKYQSPTKYLAYAQDKNCFQMRPDITVLSNGQVEYVLDAKYKELNGQGQNFGVSQADIYQMLAYSVSYKCDNIALVYPKMLMEENDDFIYQELKVENYDKITSVKIIMVDIEMEPHELANNLINALALDEKGYGN